MLPWWSALLYTLIVAALGAGCLPALDRPRPGDGSTERGPADRGPADTVPPVTKISCNGDCRDMVVSRVLLPAVSTKAIDLDGDGVSDNAVGTILLALNAAVPSLKLQEDLDTAVYMGTVLMLMRVQAASFTEAQHALLQVWQGAAQTCCTSSKDLAACKAQATQTCFSGSHSFKPDPVSPNSAVLGGLIKSAHAAFGPAKKVPVALLVTSGLKLQVQLIGARIQGDLTSQGLSNGLLGGAIPRSELEAQLIPFIAQLLNDKLTDPESDQSTKDTIKKMFDSDKDGSISAAEVKSNGLVKTFLDGDVDLDGDGINELSIGLRLEAVLAVIDS